jgi:HSP20 family protein
MSQNTAKARVPSASEADAPIIADSSTLFDCKNELWEAIARRAYAYFEERGRENGRTIDDWLRAEAELLRPLPINISEADGRLKVRAEMPGFSGREIKVSVEPSRVMISGSAEENEAQKTEKSLYAEYRSNLAFRAFELPVEADPSNVTAVLENGILEISIAKAAKPVSEQV